MSAVVRETKVRLGCLATAVWIGAWYAGCFGIGLTWGWRAGIVWWFTFPTVSMTLWFGVQELRARRRR